MTVLTRLLDGAEPGVRTRLPTLAGLWDSALCNRCANAAHHHWFGISPHEVAGLHLGALLGAQRLHHQRGAIAAVLAGTHEAFDDEHAAPGDTSPRPAEFALEPDTAADGRVLGFWLTANDLSPLADAERRAAQLAALGEAVFGSPAAGFAVFDADLRCTVANGALAGLFGTSTAQLQSHTLAALMRGSAPELLSSARATLADGQSRRLESAALRTIFGARLRAGVWLSRVLPLAEGGKPRLLMALRPAEGMPPTSESGRSRFAENISHEIRTPVNAIVGLSRLALDEMLPATARARVEKLHGSATALAGLLNDVLDHAQLEAGELQLLTLTFDLQQPLQRLIDGFADDVARKGLGFAVWLDPTLPERVIGDPQRLYQLLAQLLGNAIKFTDRGHIALSVRREGALGDVLRFALRDTGGGIEPAQREAMFDAFAQGDGSMTRRFGGTGLGLAIARRLAQLMDGEIGISSASGGGSEVWFSARLPAPPLLGGVSRAEPSPLASLRLLIATEAAALASPLVGHLALWGVDWQLARDAANLRELYTQADAAGRGFDAVLLDVQSPAGAAAVAALRTSSTDGVLRGVLAMAGHDASASRRLYRPLLPATLKRALQGVVGAAPAPAACADNSFDDQPLRGTCVLLVEDNELNRIVAEAFLSQMGVQTVVACDGEQALQRLLDPDTPAIDAVLMDLHMPVLDGLAATRRIREMPAFDGIPVIAMTAAALPENQAECFAAGMVDHVAKPIVLEHLFGVLMHWTALRRGQADAAFSYVGRTP